MGDDPDDPEEGAAKGYCRYLQLRVAGKSVKALIDSGNTFHTVISGRLAKELGIRDRDLDRDPGAASGPPTPGPA